MFWNRLLAVIQILSPSLAFLDAKADTVCDKRHESCRGGACEESETCRFPLQYLAGRQITRKYKAKIDDLWYDPIDFVVEYDYKLSTKCGNKVSVTRREYRIRYEIQPWFEACPTEEWDEEIAVGLNDQDEWRVSIPNALNRSLKDRFRFGRQPDYLVVEPAEFENPIEANVQVVNVMWPRNTHELLTACSFHLQFLS